MVVLQIRQEHGQPQRLQRRPPPGASPTSTLVAQREQLGRPSGGPARSSLAIELEVAGRWPKRIAEQQQDRIDRMITTVQ